MLMTDGHPVSIDHDAVRTDVQRARELYTRQARATLVPETFEKLRDHLRSLIPVCEDMTSRMPVGQPRLRSESAIATARHLLTATPADGPMGRLVHMQLLADSVSVLAARARAPKEPM